MENRETLIYQQICEKNFEIFYNLSQAYEAEFSAITKKVPDSKGYFSYDSSPYEPNIGYLLLQNNVPIGFCIIQIRKEINDVCEFYIIPAVRKNNIGMWFAKEIIQKYNGDWQVRQIAGAKNATLFWRKVVQSISQNNYTEVSSNDKQWGWVTKQLFTI